MRTPDAKKGSEGELPFSVCFFAIEGDDRLGVLEECGTSERVPKKTSRSDDFFAGRRNLAAK